MNAVSRWRVAVSAELACLYAANPNVAAVMGGGSAARTATSALSRIGRCRAGYPEQTERSVSEVVDIYNMRYRGSVEDRVHQLLSSRLQTITAMFGQLRDTLEDVWVEVALSDEERARRIIALHPRLTSSNSATTASKTSHGRPAPPSSLPPHS
jgi:hypothetical protein